jgi:glycosyltransferase involved in cell wall biosynthesis
MKVCLVLHPYTARKDLGFGGDRYAYELLTRLPKLGIELDPFESGQLKSIPEALAAEAKAIVRLAAAHRADLFHATTSASAMAPLSARRKPVLTTIHDVLWFFVKSRYDSRAKYFIKTRAIRRAATRSDGVIVPFRSTYDFLRDEFKVSERKLHLVPYGVDHEQFRPRGETEILVRPACMGEKKGREVLFVGAVNYGKGIDTLIRCFERVVAEVPDARLLVGSKGWDEPFISDIWANSPVRRAIEFIGFIPEPELRAAYIHADVTCFPSRYGFGLPTLESMACGTPTVSGRALDAPEFVGDAGLLADPNDEEDLAHQLVRSLTDESLRRDLIRKGLDKASGYRWELTAERTKAVYDTFI